MSEGERVTRKIRFRGTPEQLAELLRILEEHDLAILDVDVGQGMNADPPDVTDDTRNQ